ncbi:MAG: heavy metal-binding domain-containing protein [Candidatus Aadella gelida]|nr:heavy metal-binding domain-containing protein [Candidatus Aadella gelida]
MNRDPVCGMEVENQEISSKNEGKMFFFCSHGCKERFLHSPDKFLSNNNAKGGHSNPSHSMNEKNVSGPISESKQYTCSMHPEIVSDKPGDCPKCGMTLEPKNAVSEKSGEQKEIKKLARKFWIGLALGIPVVFLALEEM